MKPVTSPPLFVRRSSNRRHYRWLPFLMILTTAMLVGVVAVLASTFVLKFGTIGSDDGQFTNPRGIAVDPSGNVYVTDSSGDSRGQVQKFDANGGFLSRVGQNNGTAQGFISAYRITTDSSGNVYATDGAGDPPSLVVKKFNSSGVFQFAFGTSGAGGLFQAAAGIAVDSSGNIYVADSVAGVVRKF